MGLRRSLCTMCAHFWAQQIVFGATFKGKRAWPCRLQGCSSVLTRKTKRATSCGGAGCQPQNVKEIQDAFAERWTTQCADAFAALKHALVSAPVLMLPDFEKSF